MKADAAASGRFAAGVRRGDDAHQGSVEEGDQQIRIIFLCHRRVAGLTTFRISGTVFTSI
ncbi:hypothetical protein ACFSHQ_27105 [Gemmobacter lanyuensis]